MTSKQDRLVTYLENHPTIKQHNPLNTWSGYVSGYTVNSNFKSSL